MTTNLLETTPYARKLATKGTRSTVLESAASLVAEIMTSRRTERSKMAMIRPIVEFVKGPAVVVGVDRKKQAELAESVHDGKSFVKAVFTPVLSDPLTRLARQPVSRSYAVPLRESVNARDVHDGKSLMAAIFD